jgi:hypothetical protein
MKELDADETPVQPRVKSLVDLWNANKFAMTLVGIGAVAAVAAVVKGIALTEDAKTGGGDEPPIRVKGGSMDLRLLTKKYKWTGGPAEWYISGGSRSKADFDVVLDFAHGPSAEHNGQVLTIFHSGNPTLQLDAPNCATVVTKLDANPLTADEQSLSYKPNGHISEVRLDGKTIWPTADNRHFAELLILDYH